MGAKGHAEGLLSDGDAMDKTACKFNNFIIEVERLHPPEGMTISEGYQYNYTPRESLFKLTITVTVTVT